MALAMQQQVEYYLSEENLSKDKCLQSIMDANGWIPLKSIVAFPKMQQIHATTAKVAGALRFSDKVDVSQDERRVRVRKWWKCSRKTSPSRAGLVPAAKRPSPILASMGHPAPAADSTPPRKANAQVVMLELSATDGLRVLLQLRSKLMPVMPGHLATVGGCRDRTDPDSRYTGMREAVEETGLTGGLMYPPVKFAEGAKVDWFAMQLQNPEFGGKQDLGELDDVRSILDQLPPSARLAENFGHVWLPVSKLDDIDPSMKLMGGMLFKIRQAASHLSLLDARPAAGQAPTKAAMTAKAAAAEFAAEAATTGGDVELSSEEEEEYSKDAAEKAEKRVRVQMYRKCPKKQPTDRAGPLHAPKRLRSILASMGTPAPPADRTSPVAIAAEATAAEDAVEVPAAKSMRVN